MLRKPFTRLSQNVRHVPDNKGYTVVSLPQGMEIADDGSFSVTEKIPVVVVLDRFTSDIGNGRDYERTMSSVAVDAYVYHGELVTKYAVHGLEDKVGVLAIDIQAGKYIKGSSKWEEAFKSLIEMQKQYQNIAAVNISMASDMGFDFLYKDYGISKNDLKQNKERVVELLKEQDEKYVYQKYIYRIVRLINELADLGVEVYIGTGNENDRSFNGFTLSNAHAVSDHEGDYDNELLATDSADGTHYFRRKFDWARKQMYFTDGHIRLYSDEIDINQSGCLVSLLVVSFLFWSIMGLCLLPDVGVFITSILMGIVPLAAWWFVPNKTRGTSYATPMKLNEDLKARLNAKEPTENQQPDA